MCFHATQDIRTAWLERRDASLAEDTRGALLVFDGQTVDGRTEFALEYPYPRFDRLPDGQWIWTEGRSLDGHPNATLLSANGEVARRYCLGDGIKHLQADSAGTLWVGYSDEGIYGPNPISHPGLVRFDAAGLQIWSYDFTRPDVPIISECYALNVVDEAWACTYTGFPILQIGRTGMQRTWTNESAGAKAIAVDGDNVVLFGGYRAFPEHEGNPAKIDSRDRLALLKLNEMRADLVADVDLDFGENGKAGASLVGARGDSIHFVSAGRWFRMSVAAIFEAVGVSIG